MTLASLAITRLIRAPRERVFAAWTSPEQLKRWWGPGPITCPEAHIDLRAGGDYRIANREVDGSVIWIYGTFQQVTPPERLVYTWSVGTESSQPTLVSLDFKRHPEGTELVLRHERIASAVHRDGHAKGWNGCLDKLEALLVP